MTKRKPIAQKRTGALLVWGIPPVLRRQFRIACLTKGITMQAAIRDLMAEFAKR